ncbi:MAG TPA: aminotransferase class V-fold PLP-dependent enzyme [Acidobacteriaceae bacterium]|nr:aminotransferase class V-fold PLP-dependent enzyme [Acidobacteriaceae bacterium]
MNLPIYMDNQATTRVDPRVLEAMLPYLAGSYGNAASRSHSFGWAAEQAVETARGQVARLLGASPKEIVFTSGATEGNNLVLKGAVEAARAADPQCPIAIVTQATEHNAVLDPCAWLAKQGCHVTVLPVDPEGRIRLDDLRRAIAGEKPLLVSIMAANNEIGTVQPLAEMGALCREHGILFHTDAAQAVGKIPVDVNRSAIDLLSLSGHKIYGPKGVGALYVRRRAPRIALAEQMHGGGHERGLRSGTLNVPGIVGLGQACALAAEEMESESLRLAALRDRLQAKLLAGLDQVRVNGCQQHRLPGNLNMTFAHADSESIMMGVRDVALSSGSACTSAAIQPSHVLLALGLTGEAAHSSLRFGLGRFNTDEEVDFVADRLVDVVRKLRELSPEFAELT